MLEKASVITFIAMGTVNTITLFNQVSDEIKVAVFQLVNELEDKLTVNRPHSEVMAVNLSAGHHPVVVSPDVFGLVERAVAAALMPNSGFNPVIGSLTRLWKQALKSGELPDNTQIKQAMTLIDPQYIALDRAKSTVFLRRENMSFDFGAIGKGYIADRLVALLAQHHIYQGIIDLGGNVVVIGDSPKNSQGLWKVGIQHPFASRGQYVGVLSVRNQSVVTSGNYEKYTEINGIQYHHIIDPHTGYPFESELDSITIVSDSSTDGEILSTQVYFLGLQQGLKFLENRPRFGGIFITKDKKVHLTSNLASNFKLVSRDYELVY